MGAQTRTDILPYMSLIPVFGYFMRGTSTIISTSFFKPRKVAITSQVILKVLVSESQARNKCRWDHIPSLSPLSPNQQITVAFLRYR